MKQAVVYNLTEFAAKYQLNDIFGAYAAHLMVSDNVLKLIIDELPYEQCSITHDLGHKKEVYEIRAP